MLQIAVPVLSGSQPGYLLPRPRDIMQRAYPVAEADRIYLQAQRLVDTNSGAGRVYLADLAEALGITPIRWRSLQNAAGQGASGTRASAVSL